VLMNSIINDIKGIAYSKVKASKSMHLKFMQNVKFQALRFLGIFEYYIVKAHNI
jgi:hypothetical protein